MPEKAGNSATSCAMSVVEGLSVPVVKPTQPPSRMIDAPTIESSPMARVIMTMTGANAMNWLTPWVVQMSAKVVVMMGMKM